MDARNRFFGFPPRVSGPLQGWTPMSAQRGDRLMLLAVALVLLLSWKPAVVGMVGDGRQMVFTAVAIAESGSLGQARSRDLTVPRPAGDSVSRYGLAMSLAHVPA